MNVVVSTIIAGIFALILWCFVGSGSNEEFLNKSCPVAWANAGWEVAGPAGYEWGFGGFGTPYGGAKVWWYVRSKTTHLSYQGYCKRWGDETHLYGPMPTERYSIVN